MEIKEIQEKLNEVMNFNYEEYKKAKEYCIKLNEVLEVFEKYPEAKVLVNVPKGNRIEDEKNCLYLISEINDYFLSEFIPVGSIVANEKFIIFSAYSENESYNIDKNELGKMRENDVKRMENCAFFAKEFLRNFKMREERNKAVIENKENTLVYLEFIEDNLNWNSLNEKEKVYDAFNFCQTKVNNKSIFYLTPHY